MIALQIIMANALVAIGSYRVVGTRFGLPGCSERAGETLSGLGAVFFGFGLLLGFLATSSMLHVVAVAGLVVAIGLYAAAFIQHRKEPARA